MNVTEGNGEQVCENKKTGCDQLSKMVLNFFLPVVISHLSLSVVTFLLQPAILQSVFFLTGKNRHIRNTNDRMDLYIQIQWGSGTKRIKRRPLPCV